MKRLIISYGGKYSGFVTKQTNFIIVGSKPSKKLLKKAQELKRDLILYVGHSGTFKAGNGTTDPRGGLISSRTHQIEE